MKASRDFGPISKPSQPSGIPSYSVIILMLASFLKSSAITKSHGRCKLTLCSLAKLRISGTI